MREYLENYRNSLQGKKACDDERERVKVCERENTHLFCTANPTPFFPFLPFLSRLVFVLYASRSPEGEENGSCLRTFTERFSSSSNSFSLTPSPLSLFLLTQAIHHGGVNVFSDCVDVRGVLVHRLSDITAKDLYMNMVMKEKGV